MFSGKSKFKLLWFIWALARLLLIVGCSAPHTVDPRLAAYTPHLSAASYVDPFIGTGGDGHTFPGATVPFGMVQWSPDTRGLERGWYRYGDDTNISGFGVTHLSGAGCPMFGDFPILPWTGDIVQNPAQSPQVFVVPFQHTATDGTRLESAEPGYYFVNLGNGVQVQLTSAKRSGIGIFTFPSSGQRRLLINTGGSLNIDQRGRETDSSSAEIIGDDTLFGTVSTGGFCGLPNDYTLHIYIKFDTAFTSFGVWNDQSITPKARSTSGHKTGAYVSFDDPRGASVRLRFGISYVSRDNARQNLEAEIPTWNFDAVRRRAQREWEKALSPVEIEGGSTDQRTIFYTALYHMLIAPNTFSDNNGDYIGFDGFVHNVGSHIQYANFSDWDTYRTVIQLQAMLFPREASDMMDSLVRDGEQIGALPKWPVANDVSNVMGGDSPVMLLANAYAFGAHLFDLRAALSLAVRGATEKVQGPHGYIERADGDLYNTLGFVPAQANNSCVSHTLEYASADFAISRMAAAIGDRETEREFTRLSKNWINLFDPSIGLTHPKNQDGSFMLNFDAQNALPKRLPPYEDQFGYEEGTTWQYTWMVAHDMQSLFSAMGGSDRAIEKLDQFFSDIQGSNGSIHFNPGNEPDIGAPYAYVFAGAPFRTQALVPRILSSSFAPSPDGLPGNDDLGTISGTYVWGALGLYPAIPGVGKLIIGTPMFSKVTIRLGDGRTLTVRAFGHGPYVQSETIDGVPSTKSWISLNSLRPTSEVNFMMDDSANVNWGTTKADLPKAN